MDHLHYVPIVKAKKAERWALGRLQPSTKKKVTPLFEISPVRKKNGVPVKSIDQHLHDSIKGIVSSWGTKLCYVDTKWLYSTHGDGPMRTVFAEARRQSLIAVPVIQPSNSSETLKEAAKIVKRDGQGVLLRARRSDLQQPETIRTAIAAVGLGPRSVDFLLDYRNQAMTLATDYASIGEVHPAKSWRNLIAASGVFPESVGDCEDGYWHAIERDCWSSWMQETNDLTRIPSFSDYLVRDPGAPPSGGSASVTLRYTTDEHWLVRVNGRLRDGEAPQMHGLCGELRHMSDFAGSEFSAGDQEIERSATYANMKSGGSTEWLQWAENHHVEHVVTQLAKSL